jgi:hypothetical protein
VPALPPSQPPSPPPAEVSSVAPASPRKPAAPAPNHVAIRLGAGVGRGDGFAGLSFAQLDAWPLTWLGIGVEGELAGTQGLSVFGSTDAVGLRAARGRAAVRWIIPARKAFVTLGGAVGVGPGVATRIHYFSLPCDFSTASCDKDIGVGDFVPTTSVRHALTTSLELALRAQWRVFELGGFLRYEFWPEQGLFTLGPTLGVAF